MQVPKTEILIRASDGSELLRAELTPGEYVLGRDDECHVCIEAEEVAPKHAQLTINFDHATIEDLGSDSGTLVNGKPVSDSVRLWPGQRIQVGSTTVELHRQQMIAQTDVSLAPQTAATKTLLPPELLRERRYEVGGVVARGGMGAILNATEGAIERAVAMKVMLENSSPDDLVRFIAEAKVTGQLEHPNIVPVHELGVDENDQVFYTMKFVRGITLKKVLELMASGMPETIAKYPLGSLLTIFQKVCDAMAFAHSKRVIHRDLKPENIMLGDYGEVLVMDWGLAKVLDHGVSTASVRTVRSGVWRSVSPEATGATMKGSIMGTPQYMAPEQARGEVDTLDERADIYALGAILYHILALRPSVEGKDPWAIVNRVASGTTDPLPNLQSAHLPDERIPDSLAAVVRTAMAFDQTQRYASVADLQADITAFQNGFATSAEHAGAIRQLHLLMMRHKALAFSIAAGVVLTAAFMAKVIHSERTATAAKIVAQQSEAAAKEAKKIAEEKTDAARRALARSEVSLAEAAYREFDGRGMRAALESVPEELRDTEWRYLSDRADNSQTTFSPEEGKLFFVVAAHPTQPGVFALGGDEARIAFVDAMSGQRVLEFPLAPGQQRGSRVAALAFSPDGERLLVGKHGKNSVAIYESRTGKALVEWDATDIDRAGFSPDGTKAFSRATNSDFAMHDAASGRELWTARSVYRATFTPAGQLIAANGRSLRLLDGATGALIRKLPDVPDGIPDLRLSVDGAMLVLGCSDSVVRIMRLADGAITFEQRLAENRRNPWVAISTDGRRVLGVVDQTGGRRTARVWDATSGVTLQTLMGGNGRIDGVALHPLTDEVIIVGPDTRAWAVATRPVEANTGGTVSASVFWGADDLFIGSKQPAKFGGGKWNAQPFTLPPECANASIVSSGGDFAVFAQSDGKGSPVAIFQRTATGYSLLHMAKTKVGLARGRMSADGQRFATVDNRIAIEIFDTATGERVRECGRGKIRYIQELGWLGHDRLVGIGNSGERGKPETEEWITLWDATTGRVLREARNATPLDQLATAPDGRTFAEAGDDRRVRIRDAQTLEIVREFRAHDGAITALAFHPTKPVLASAAMDFTVRLWNPADASLIEELRLSAAETTRLAFSPGGTRLASTDRKNATAMLNLETPPLGKFTRRSGTKMAAASATASASASTARSTANAHARAGRFAEAKAAFTEAIALDPSAGFDWARLSVALAQLGDEAAYRAHAHKALETFAGTTDPETMERIAKACLLLPLDDADRAIALKLAHAPIAAAPEHPGRTYFQFVDAFAHYRAGTFAKAADALTAIGTGGVTPTQVQVAAVLAMAQHHLGKTDEALATLVRGESIDGERLPPPGTDLGDGWHDVLIARTLLKEARALIAPGTQAAPPPARALGAAHARFGRWAEAKAAFAEAARVEPDTIWSWHRLAVVLTVLGERAEQRRVCREMIAHFGNSTDVFTRDNVAKSAHLYPIDDLTADEREIILRLADSGVKPGDTSTAAQFLEFARSLAHYRAGDFAGAAAPLAQWEMKPTPQAAAAQGAVLAMSQQRLGKAVEARATLTRAEAFAAEKFPLVGTDLGASWYDVAIARILLAEARTLIAPGTQAQLRTAGSASAAGETHARAGRWAEARTAFTEAIQLKLDDHMLWFRLGVVLTQIGDRAAQRKLSHAMLARFATSTSTNALDVSVKTCLLYPLDDMDAADRATVLRLADRIGSESYDYFELCQALAHYRTGDFAGAASPLAKWAGKITPVVVAADGAVFGMAQFRLGKKADARTTLEQAEAYVAERFPKPGTDPGGAWPDVTIARLLLREARETMGK